MKRTEDSIYALRKKEIKEMKEWVYYKYVGKTVNIFYFKDLEKNKMNRIVSGSAIMLNFLRDNGINVQEYDFYFFLNLFDHDEQKILPYTVQEGEGKVVEQVYQGQLPDEKTDGWIRNPFLNPIKGKIPKEFQVIKTSSHKGLITHITKNHDKSYESFLLSFPHINPYEVLPLMINKGHEEYIHPKEMKVFFNEEDNDFFDYHLVHMTSKASLKHIFKTKSLCYESTCKDNLFDESGKYKGDLKETPPDHDPGIYFSLLSHGGLPTKKSPLTLEEPFYFFESLFAEKTLKYTYGGAGFLFPLEDIFSKYVVSVKSDENYGKGDQINFTEYVYNYSGESIVKASRIPISLENPMLIEFSFTEIDYIYKSLYHIFKRRILFKEVVSLYREKADQHWFIRKSYLFALLQCLSDDELPPIYAIVQPKNASLSKGSTSLLGNPKEDIESDWEQFNPNDNFE